MSTAPRAGPVALGLNYLRGVLMGAADVVPGVSGGTVALIVGIYERLVHSIRAAAAAPLLFVRGDLAAARRRWSEVEWLLVLPLAAGIATALVVGAAVIVPLRRAYPEATQAVFFGLIAASVPVPWRRIAARTPRVIGLLAVAAVGAYVLVGLPERQLGAPSLPLVFACAMVAICAMILPGISGAFLLLVFGIYDTTLQALREVNVAYIAVFVAGAALGLGLFARLLDALLARQHDLTMAVLVGLMVGALRALWPWLDADRGLLLPPADASTAGVVALALAAFALVTALVALARRRSGAGERLSA